MAALAGKDLAIQVNTTGSTYVTVGGARTKSVQINGEYIDITNSDSVNLMREALATYGVRSMTISGAGVFLDDTAANAALNKILSTATLINMKVVLTGLGTFGPFAGVFTSISIAGVHNGEVTYDMTIESSGDHGFVAS